MDLQNNIPITIINFSAYSEFSTAFSINIISIFGRKQIFSKLERVEYEMQNIARDSITKLINKFIWRKEYEKDTDRG